MELPGGVRDPPAHLEAVLLQPGPVDGDRAALEGDEAHEEAHEGALAAAVRPQEPHDAPRLHGELEAVLERDLVAEAMAEVADDDRPLPRRGGAVDRPGGGAVLVAGPGYERRDAGPHREELKHDTFGCVELVRVTGRAAGRLRARPARRRGAVRARLAGARAPGGARAPAAWSGARGVAAAPDLDEALLQEARPRDGPRRAAGPAARAPAALRRG